MLESARLVIRSASAQELEQLIGGARAFEHTTGLRVVEGYLEFPEALPRLLDGLRLRPDEAEWRAPLLFVHRADRSLVGLGGFKGPPDAEGTVELGYGIAPAYRGQGLATEAVRAMVGLARVTGPRSVIAHTLPERSPSTSVLERCGFRLVGLVTESGTEVWRWQLETSSSAP